MERWLVALEKSTTKGENLKGGLASNSWILMRYCNMLHIAYFPTAVEVPHFC